MLDEYDDSYVEYDVFINDMLDIFAEQECVGVEFDPNDYEYNQNIIGG